MPTGGMGGRRLGYVVTTANDGRRDMPARPGSKRYDIHRARLRNALDNAGQAVDADADAVANEILRERHGRAGIVRGERGLGPKSERARDERR
ncbi:MAG TPA: hypothetical protein VIL44_09345 [Micromonospora sp.]